MAAGLLYAAAVAIRLLGISEPALQGDEFLWLERSRLLIQQLQQGNYSVATTHLKHPGIPPAFVLGTAQKLGSYYNQSRGLNQQSADYLRPETAARASNAVVSSLCAPTIFLLGASFVGGPAAFVGGALVAFAPHHIELSRVVHLDGMFSFFVTLSLLLFANAVVRGSISLKLLAGLSWGLCIATKPTAATLVVAFLLYKLFRHWFLSETDNKGDRGVFVWSDVAALLIAHLFLAAIYTRLWVHGSHRLGRFLLSSRLADLVYEFGLFLQGNMTLSLSAAAVLALLCLFSVLSIRREPQRIFWAPAQRICLYGSCLVLLLYLALAPQVLENTIRYWTFAAGLANEVHIGGWGVWRPPPYGYAEFFARKLPSFAILGVFLSLFYLVADVVRQRGRSGAEKICFHLLCLLAVLIWVAPLNSTSKQDFRYVIPIVPVLYLFVAIGFFRLWRSLALILARRRKPRISRVAVLASPALVMFAALTVAASSYPHYSLHFSAISGGLRAAKQRRIKFPLVSHRDALTFLHTQAEADAAVRHVLVVGEVPESVKHYYQALYREAATFLKFPAYYYPSAFEYVIVFGSYPENLSELERLFGSFGGLSTVYTRQWQGVEILRILKVGIPDFRQKRRFEIPWGVYLTGGHRHLQGTRRAAEQSEDTVIGMFASPDRHSPGILLGGLRTRVAKGRYRVQFELAMPGDVEERVEFGPQRYAARIEFGDCQRIVTKGQLSRDEFRWQSMECDVELDSSRYLQSYWFGNVPLLIRAVEIEQIADETT